MDTIPTNNIFFNYKHCNNLVLDEPSYLLIAGAGLKGYYTSGMCNIIRSLYKNKSVKGIYTHSSGCLTSICIAIGYDPMLFEEDYQKIRCHFIDKKKNIIDIFIDIIKEKFTENTYKLCNEYNINIIASEITLFGLKKTVFNNFKSNDELLLCAKASMTIPYLVNSKIWYTKINDKYYIDGGFTGLIPYNDNTNDQQIALKNYNIYTYSNFMYPECHSYIPLMIDGHNDLIDFIIEQKDKLLICKITNRKNYLKKMKQYILLVIVNFGFYFLANR